MLKLDWVGRPSALNPLVVVAAQSIMHSFKLASGEVGYSALYVVTTIRWSNEVEH